MKTKHKIITEIIATIGVALFIAGVILLIITAWMMPEKFTYYKMILGILFIYLSYLINNLLKTIKRYTKC